MFYSSANRDEAAFPDASRFDVTRSPNEHVAFGGGGAHYCLGANLARVEIRAPARRGAGTPARPGARRPGGAPALELHQRAAAHAGALRGALSRGPVGDRMTRLPADGREVQLDLFARVDDAAHASGGRGTTRARGRGGRRADRARRRARRARATPAGRAPPRHVVVVLPGLARHRLRRHGDTRPSRAHRPARVRAAPAAAHRRPRPHLLRTARRGRLRGVRGAGAARLPLPRQGARGADARALPGARALRRAPGNAERDLARRRVGRGHARRSGAARDSATRSA